MKVRVRRVLSGLFMSMALYGQTPARTNWVLAFGDEFEAKDLDFTRWSPHSASTSASAALVVPGAIAVAGGHALITASRENGRYTSGAMSTLGSFAQTYGRFEVRMKAPSGRGLETRCRLLPVPSGEFPAIDLLRVAGPSPSHVMFGNQWGDEKTERGYSGAWDLPKPADGFHVFAVEWDAAKIVWFVDGKERFRSVDGVPHQPMYVEVDLNIGGPEAKWPDSSTPFPAVLEIDYIRVFTNPAAAQPH